MPLLLLLCACDDTTFHGAAGEAVEGAGWEGAIELFDRDCVACHAGDSPAGGMNLAADACAALVGVTSQGYAPALRVAPGDSAASVLWNKLAGTEAFDGAMPPGSGTAPQNAEMIAAWIDEGAPCSR